MTYKNEANQIIESYLQRTFYKSWASPELAENSYLGNYRAFEFVISPACTLACRYCYLHPRANDAYPQNIQTPDIERENATAILDFFSKNKYKPQMEIFGGEATVKNISYFILDKVLEYRRNGNPVDSGFILPTNMGFLQDEAAKEKMTHFVKEYKKAGSYLSLSASVDGLYLEENRPARSKKFERGPKFYYDLFTFAKEYNCGFHPMVYAGGIEKWIKNFLWYQDKFKEFDIPWDSIYLLEVRNNNWTNDKVAELMKFVTFLIEWLWNESERDAEKYFHNLFKRKGFNMLSAPFSSIGRGIGCSIQSTFQMRLGDLSVFPCHRLMYDPLKAFHYVKEDKKIVGVEADNVELYLATNSGQHRMEPMCEQCSIRSMCSLGCLGSQYETTGDMFSPIPTVCKMEHGKVIAMLKAYKRLGLLAPLLEKLGRDKQAQIFDLDKGGLL